jgi:hypothetical protein
MFLEAFSALIDGGLENEMGDHILIITIAAD